jgi:hypothetical protein
MPATYQKKVRPNGGSTTRNELQLKRSALSRRFTERAAPLWMARGVKTSPHGTGMSGVPAPLRGSIVS